VLEGGLTLDPKELAEGRELWSQFRAMSDADQTAAMGVMTMAHHMPEGAAVVSMALGQLDIGWGPRLTAVFTGICQGKPLWLYGLMAAMTHGLSGMTAERLTEAIDAVVAGGDHGIDVEAVVDEASDFECAQMRRKLGLDG